jgi:hypothetical protein
VLDQSRRSWTRERVSGIAAVDPGAAPLARLRADIDQMSMVRRTMTVSLNPR